MDHDPLKKSDAIILLEGDGNSRLKFACDLYHEDFAKTLVFSGGIENLSYGSFPFELLEEDFKRNNVDPKDIIVERKSQHTREQAIEIIKMCKDKGWKRIILVASHYHQLRAYLTFLKILLEEKLESTIQIFNAPANDLSWFEYMPWGTRFDLLDQEFDRINYYYSQGHLASYEQTINYQRWKECQQ